VPLKETIRGFKMIVDGDVDYLPEQAFYMVGGIDEAMKKAEEMGAQGRLSDPHRAAAFAGGMT